VTLILSLIRNEYVVQVADRRVTWPDGRIGNDDTIKSVVLSNQMIFSFAGMATIGHQTTDFWLTTALTELTKTSSTEDACNWIAYRATEVCRKLQVDKASKRLAFVGVGFSTETNTSPLRPVFVRISNFHNEKNEESQHASDQFTYHSYAVNDGEYRCWHTPAWLATGELSRLTRQGQRVSNSIQA
jgi:hypothetical protein